MHLIVLALQVIHRIARKVGMDVDIPTFFELYGAPPEVFNNVVKRLSILLEELVRSYGVSWWDIYAESDIGKERLLIAEEIGLSRNDRVVDVGCGRGYFTIAAKFASYVVAVDLMDGFWTL